MRPDQAKYILENIDKKPIEKIAQELALKERKIRRFLEKERKENKQLPPEGVRTGGECVAKRSLLFLSLLLIIIVGCVVYGNSLKGEFVWDDEVLIKDNVYITHRLGISKIFTMDIGGGYGLKSRFYRPLQILTYRINYALGKFDVIGYHLMNVALHILVALCVYWLASILFTDAILSLFTGLLYVSHPVHSEVISYISARADPLVLLFMLISFIFYIKSLSSHSPIFSILIVVNYILALLSKEYSLILPFIFLLYHYAFKVKVKIIKFLPVVTMAFLYIILRITLLKSLLSHTTVTSTLAQRLPGFFVAISNYLRLLLLPLDLHIEYGLTLFKFTHPQAILGLIILLVSLFYAFRTRNTNRFLFFAITWFFITLLPQSNLYPINAYMSENWLYTPSIGFFLIIAGILNSLYKKRGTKIVTLTLLMGITAFYSYLAIEQNRYWKNAVILNERTLRYAPNNAKVYNDLGKARYNEGKYEEAIELFKKAIALIPHFSNPYNNLSAAYHAVGKDEEAIASLKKALEIDPNNTSACFNLGFLYSSIGKYGEAVPLFEKAVELQPEDVAYNNLGIAYSKIGKSEEAIRAYKRAIELKPDCLDAYNNLGVIYNILGRSDEAIDCLQKVLTVNPRHAQAYNNLAIAYYLKKQYDLAIKHCDKAEELGYKVNPAFLKSLEPYRK